MPDLYSRLTTGQTSRCLLSCEITQPGGKYGNFHASRNTVRETHSEYTLRVFP